MSSLDRSLACALLLGVPLLSAGAGAGPPSVQEAAAVRTGRANELLLRSLDVAFEPAHLKGALHALGPAAIPELVEILGRGELRSGDEIRALEPRYELLILSALSSWPDGAFASTLERMANTDAEPGFRAAALRALAWRGRRQAIPVLLAVAPPGREATFVEAEVRSAFGAALQQVLQRDAGARAFLVRHLPRVHPALLETVVDVLGAEAGPLALETLGELLGRRRGMDALLLLQIGRLARKLPATTGLRVGEDVRPYLAHHEPALAILAADACGQLRDFDAIPLLVEALDGRDPNVRAMSASALARITGLGYGDDADDWHGWLDEELAWWATEEERCREAIAGGAPAEVVDAVRAVGLRKLHPELRAELLTLALDREEPDVLRLAALRRGEVPSRHRLARLVALLEHPTAEVRENALAGLRAITGNVLTPDPRLWRRKLGTP